LIGFVRLLADWCTRGYISNLCVDSQHQHKGVGKMLMLAILTVCDKKRILVLNVYDTTENPNFYKNCGCEAAKKRLGYTASIGLTIEEGHNESAQQPA
jgi:ribosomal protein S18 acetylase RimI-like enzyme